MWERRLLRHAGADRLLHGAAEFSGRARRAGLGRRVGADLRGSAIGGWVGDRVLGTRRTMLLGAVVLAIGYGLMVVPGDNVWFLFCSLGVIVVGNGLFKANTGNLVRKIYEGDDSRIDSAFTIYYMAVNLGAMISQLLTPWLKDYVNERYGDGLGTSRLRCARSACCWAWAIPRSPAIRN